MDAVLGLILDTLEAKDLLDVVNVIITSDHGMTNVNRESKVTFVSCFACTKNISTLPSSTLKAKSDHLSLQ